MYYHRHTTGEGGSTVCVIGLVCSISKPPLNQACILSCRPHFKSRLQRPLRAALHMRYAYCTRCCMVHPNTPFPSSPKHKPNLPIPFPHLHSHSKAPTLDPSLYHLLYHCLTFYYTYCTARTVCAYTTVYMLCVTVHTITVCCPRRGVWLERFRVAVAAAS